MEGDRNVCGSRHPPIGRNKKEEIELLYSQGPYLVGLTLWLTLRAGACSLEWVVSPVGSFDTPRVTARDARSLSLKVSRPLKIRKLNFLSIFPRPSLLGEISSGDTRSGPITTVHPDVSATIGFLLGNRDTIQETKKIYTCRIPRRTKKG